MTPSEGPMLGPNARRSSMRNSFRSWVIVGAAAVTAAVFAGACLYAGEDDEDDAAEVKKLAQEALDKSVARGKELFRSKDLGKKTCAECHENPDKPQLNLVTRPFGYPAYSVKKRSVVSLGQKINEMLSGKARGKEMDLGSGDLVALEAYVMSLKKGGGK
jgi:cytochrome c